MTFNNTVVFYSMLGFNLHQFVDCCCYIIFTCNTSAPDLSFPTVNWGPTKTYHRKIVHPLADCRNTLVVEKVAFLVLAMYGRLRS